MSYFVQEHLMYGGVNLTNLIFGWFCKFLGGTSGGLGVKHWWIDVGRNGMVRNEAYLCLEMNRL